MKLAPAISSNIRRWSNIIKNAVCMSIKVEFLKIKRNLIAIVAAHRSKIKAVAKFNEISPGHQQQYSKMAKYNQKSSLLVNKSKVS